MKLITNVKIFKELINNFNSFSDGRIDKESLENTPNRLAKMFVNELLIGYKESPEEILSKQFETDNNEMIIIKDIPFVSLCTHHWLPFIGIAHVGYLPKNNKIVGLSKIPRIVKCFSRRFQIQENMTSQIADSIFNILKPEGVIVITEAQHLCAQIRGVQAHSVKMKCSAIRGCFEKPEIKEEFLKLL